MYRKIGLIICAWTLAFVLGSGAYADSTIKPNTANTIEIFKPEVGSEGDVILKKDTLYVNLRLSGKSVVYMSLYRIDPEFYLGSQPKSDVTFVPSDDYDNLTLEQKMYVYTTKAKLETLNDTSRGIYNDALAAVRKQFGDVAKMDALKASGTMDTAQLALYDRYRKAYADYVQKNKSYTAVKAQYDKLFTRLIYGPVEVKPTDILLTYQTEIQGVKPGTYVLAFSDKADGTQIIKTLEFKGETSEKTVEKMLDTLPQSINNLFIGPAQ